MGYIDWVYIPELIDQGVSQLNTFIYIPFLDKQKHSRFTLRYIENLVTRFKIMIKTCLKTAKFEHAFPLEELNI
jgi:hypothetical protein